MSFWETLKNQDSSQPTDPISAIKQLGKERLAELKSLGEKLFEHIPPRDLITLLFPPAMGIDILAGAISDKHVDDNFNPKFPDQNLTKACLDMAEWFSNNYFSTKITGLENVPKDGAALLAGNHSAGLMPIDALFAMRAIHRAQSCDRIVHPLVHDFAYAAPRIARNAQKMGILRATKKNALEALEANRLVLVYPGGDQDAFRTFKERGKIVLAGRKGFVKTAMIANVPIVPLVSIGLHESFIVLSKGQRIAEKLGLKKLFRTDLFPISLSFPWGISPAFLPFLPLPTSVEMHFCEPIWATGDPEDSAVVDSIYSKVNESMQATMDDLSKNRIPWFGR